MHDAGTAKNPSKSLAEHHLGHDGTTTLWDELIALDHGAAVRRYRASVGCFDDRMFELDDEQLDRSWTADAGVGRWSVRVVLGHLADAEMVVAHRIRRAVAEPGSVVAYWDEQAWIDSGLYAPASALPEGAGVNTDAPAIGAFVATVYTLRQWVGEWAGALTDEAWSRRVLHEHLGPVGVRELVAFNTWHLEHHAWYLNAKITKLLGPREACEPTDCANPACACGPKGEGAG